MAAPKRQPKTPKKIRTRTQDDRKTRKVTGSRAAVKGFDFEELVALVYILEAEFERQDRDPRLYHFVAYEDAFVDDLVISRPGGHRQWFQIRARQNPTWPKDLTEDFESQRRENPNDELIYCVDSQTKQETLKTDPQRLINVVVEYVDIDLMVAPHCGREIANQLSHLTQDGRHLDQAASLWAFMQAAWRMAGRRSTLEDIMDHAAELSCGAIRSAAPCTMEQSRILELLSKIERTRFTGDRRYIEYARLTPDGSRAKYRGRVPWHDLLDAFVEVPKTWEAFDDGLDALSRS